MTRHVPALDGVRGLAILLVMTRHFAHFAAPHTTGPGLWRYLELASLGWIGVDLFFVLSGFLITGILIDALEAGSPHLFRDFYARRALRILPVYYAVLAIVFLVLPHCGELGEPARILAVRQVWLWTHTANLDVALNGWGLTAGWLGFAHLWSLAVEEQFYLIWPVLVWAVYRRAGLSGLAWTFLACCAAAPLARLAVTPRAAYVLMPCRMDTLAIGALGAAVVRLRGRFEVQLLAGLGLVCGLLGFLAVGPFLGDLEPEDPVMARVGFTLTAWLGLSLVLAAWLALPGSAGHRLLTARWLRAAGRYSYAAYLYHSLFGRGLETLARPLYARLGGVPGVLLFTMFGCIVTFAVAAASYHGFEVHFLRLKRHFEGRSGRWPTSTS